MKPIQYYKNLTALLVTRRWPWVLAIWIILAVGLRWVAPSWDKVAKDGDFEFLPASLPSRVGQRLLDEAFPKQRARSRMVIIVQREDRPLENADLAVCYDLGRRFLQLGAAVIAERGNADSSTIKSLLDDSIQMDSLWFDAVRSLAPQNSDLLGKRMVRSYFDRSNLLEKQGEPAAAKLDRESGELLARDSTLEAPAAGTLLAPSSPWNALLDVWTWEEPVLGGKLGYGHDNARMIVLQLNSEFMAVGNIKLMEAVEYLVEDVRKTHRTILSDGLAIGISGPPAVGADMLRAAKASVQRTEWISLIMVLGILAAIYRGPLLITIPLVTILLSLSVSMSVVSLLAKSADVDHEGFGLFQVFTTTRIFVVVLLFGIGTDFCLFLVSRCREALQASPRANRRTMQRIVSGSWLGVHDALVGSALTTSVGLLMMYFSDFDKFRSSGVVIAISILITLIACLTFTPALMCGLGHLAFWPVLSKENSNRGQSQSIVVRFWSGLSHGIISRPRTVLIICLVVLGIPATQGVVYRGWVTYDFLRELSWSAPSRRGARLIDKFFSTRDNSPITVVMVAKEPLDETHMREAVNRARLRLYLPQVAAVRSLTDPLGDYPPERRMGLLSSDAWKRRLLENHRLTKNHYVAVQDGLAQRAARLDVLIEPDPFSAEAEELLVKIRETLNDEITHSDSPWLGAEFACTGTTAGIADLKSTTQADQQRIQILVAIGVWGVLFGLLRRPWFSAYLMLSVLLSYLTTLGLTQWFFAWAYGSDFVGLDWKVPLFLFVILVAVGQDYNVYLATRVMEEQKKHGPIQGLFHAMVTTGGIITSCGLVMAATFLSMTGGALSAWMAEMNFPVWLGADADAIVLRGIVELGFALGLGVLIDTLIVRTVLVPAMIAWTTRWRSSLKWKKRTS
jgi:RND superfamily putative drug exporter